MSPHPDVLPPLRVVPACGALTSLLRSLRPPQDASGTYSGHLSVLQRESTVDEHVIDPFRGPARILVRGFGTHRSRIEDHDIGLVSRGDLASVAKPESLGRRVRSAERRVGREAT